MCLIVNEKYKKQPDGSIRYKLMKFYGLDRSLVYGTNQRLEEVLGVGGIRKATPLYERFYSDPTEPGRYGIHVCVDQAGAKLLARLYVDGGSYKEELAIVKVSCKGFLAGGTPGFGDRRADASTQETWEEVTILEIEPAFNAS